MTKDFHTQLLAPFEDSEIEWRLTWKDDEKSLGKAVPYVTNRAIQNRLDDVMGADNWKNEYIPWHGDGKKSGQLCGISIYFENRKEWITKYDGAEDSDVEPVKGGLSDSMKRAAVQWGMGRYLYGMDVVFIKTEKRGRSTYIAASETGKLNKAHQDLIASVFKKNNKPPTPQANGLHEITNTAPVQSEKPVAQSANSNVSQLPQNAVWVDGVAYHNSPKGDQKTNLKLRDTSGQTIEAFFDGIDQELIAGAILTNTKFSSVENQGVKFNILDKYEIFQKAAA